MSKNPGIRKRVTRPDTGPKSMTPAEEVNTVAAIPPSPHSNMYILSGQIPGPLEAKKHQGDFELVHPPAWQADGSNPYSRDDKNRSKN